MGSIVSHNLGRYAEGFAAYEAAMSFDPLSSQNMSLYIQALLDRNRLDEADRVLEKLAFITPSRAAGLRGLRTSLGGKWANLVSGSLDALQIDPSLSIDLVSPLAVIGLESEALAISELTSPRALRMLGRSGDAGVIAKERLANDPNYVFADAHLGMSLASAGDYSSAGPILEQAWQRSGGGVAYRGRFRASNAVALIAIRRDAGDDIRELVAAVTDNVRRYREAEITRVNLRYNYSADYEEGIAAFLSGERGRGLTLIAKAAEDGFFIMPNEAYLQELYDDPGFAPIRAGQEARQKRERHKFLTIVCNDNPYADVWQPEEGTCEQFAGE
jgi:tetratricopeptide (TPR) repeat protein